MKIARIAGIAAIAAAGAFAAAPASAAPALNLATGDTASAKTEATPVYHRGYAPYYNGYYGYPRRYARPYYAPPAYYYPPRRYYRPYASYPRYYGYRRPHSGLYIRTPGLRLGIGF